MAAPFKRTRSGVSVRLAAPEREILIQLLGQLDTLLDDGTQESGDPLEALVGIRGSDLAGRSDEAAGPPEATAGRPEPDPALARLLPAGNRDDEEAAAEYRRLTEYGLRSRKRSSARLAAAALGRAEPVRLSTEEAVALMKSMTDVRLVLGERLELRTDQDAELLHRRLRVGDGEPSWLAIASIYEVLTSWQEYLLSAVSRLT